MVWTSTDTGGTVHTGGTVDTGGTVTHDVVARAAVDGEAGDHDAAAPATTRGRAAQRLGARAQLLGPRRPHVRPRRLRRHPARRAPRRQSV